ncbi:hypothetical protein KFK09_027964 [Dendrobium nobile]|uniref:Uncharacterized protein n=1 Tax=Dendrobium nobile TaxID=94219 RepID=A0A8T3A1V4_DENNO|nr:hypothetical protein KFK09_027964 [Dendrobium nobile]
MILSLSLSLSLSYSFIHTSLFLFLFMSYNDFILSKKSTCEIVFNIAWHLY